MINHIHPIQMTEAFTTRIWQTVILLLVLFSHSYSQKKETDLTKPPAAKKTAKELTAHGDTRIDHYYWLNNREDPEVISYLDAENAYTARMLQHTEKQQEELFEEMKGRIRQNDKSVPYRLNGFIYYTRYEEGKEYPFYCRRALHEGAPEVIMLDVNALSEGYSYYQIGSVQISPDNSIAAYGVDTLSRRIYSIKFKNLATGEYYKDEIPNTTGSVAWADDNKTVYYTVKDNTLRPYRIYRHRLGDDPANDVLMYEESDATFNSWVYRAASGRFIFIASSSTVSNEYRILPADNPGGEFAVFEPRQRGHEYSIASVGDKFYIITNLDAKNFRLMETTADKTEKKHWKEKVAHRSDVFLEGMTPFNDYLVLEERKNGLIGIRVMNLKENKEHYINFGEETYVAWSSTNPEPQSELFRYGYSSLTTPNSVYDYNMKTGEKILLKQDEVVGDFSAENYHAERIYAKAKDGKSVPISLVYRKGTKKDGTAPLLLYGYGSYGISSDPYFNAARLSLLDRGFIYAIAHIRGGQELGREWYEDGKLLKKINTFTDFIASGEYLVQQKYTSKSKMFAMGGSAGGLLIGAVVNMAPDLFHGVIASVPFVDVVTTMLDASIPLTTGEYDEWGNPEVKEYYDYMLSYSPYDNVQKKAYPNMLVTTGLHDSQVQYWEPAKWVAKLREMKTDNNLLLLDTDMEAGHSGTSGRFKRFRKTALEYAFLIELAGVKN
ncbi:MAG: S9 family peptidase [Ignavibacteriaceae bacterium]|nr:S9 family peptidase [Ignavibacteriaceae bacterium]